MKRITLMSADPIAIPLLEWLHRNSGERFEFMELISQPPRPSGRGQRLQHNPIATRALAMNVNLHCPEKPEAELIARLKTQKPTLVLVMGYGHILKDALLSTAEHFLNFHTSILPAYRGASPIETAISCGATRTGVSLMQMARKMDTGAVLASRELPITELSNAGELREQLAQATVALLADKLESILEGNCKATEQDETKATYCRKLRKADGQLDFKQAAEKLARRINGLFPWPGCTAELKQGLRLKLKDARKLNAEHSEMPAGTILGLCEKGLKVATGSGVLCVGSLQRPGGQMLKASDFVRGLPLESECFQSETMSELLVPKP